MTEKYDFIIIGAGCSGLSSAMYGARLGMKVLVLGHSYNSGLPIGGTITMTNVVENYPGFIKTSGLYLSKQIKDHAQSYDLVTIKQEEVKEVSKIDKKEEFYVKTNKAEYTGKAILFATGTKVKKLEVPGGEKFENRGVSYCALCDGALYKDKILAVVGGSNSAACEALMLSEYAKKIYIVYRGERFKSEAAAAKKLEQTGKVEIICNTNVIEVLGNNKVNEIILDKPYKGNKSLKVEGIFVAIGHEVLSDLAKSLGVKLNEKKEIKINHMTCETNIKGIFASGDVTDKQFKQLITSVADGCTASYSAYKYIKGI
jgi:thioredoxin reductase (NADPH)